MKLHSFTSLLLVLTTALHAQTAAPLDTAAARATLAVPAKRLVSKAAAEPSPVVRRSYGKSAKGVDVEILDRADGRREERPYVAVPILFVKNSDELLDTVSRSNVRELAAIVRDFTAKGARFTIQGHASAEGDAQHNHSLSDRRAAKIRSLLVDGHGLEASSLSATGFGASCATAPATAPESELQKDRRVLVVKD
ncbi:MAG: OmpA family protein [Roseimicrobium sp.]